MSDTAAPSAPAASSGDTSQEQSGSGSGEDSGKKGSSLPSNPEMKAKPPAYRKYKVGDSEMNLTDDDVARYISKGQGADAKFREAAEARKSVDEFMKKLTEDPEAVLNDKRLSLDRRKLAEKWLTEQIEAELKPVDPRDKKLSEYEKKLKEFEDRDKATKESEEKQAYEKEREQRKTAIGHTLHEAMQKTHLSANPESAAATLREMAMYMRAAKERGEDVSPDELVAHIHNSRFQQFYTLANQFEGDQLIEFLGEEVVKRIRSADLARLRASRNPGETHRSEGEPNQRRNNKQAPKMDSIAAMRHAKKLLG